MKKILIVAVLVAGWIAAGDIARAYWIGRFTTMFPDQNAEYDADANYLFGPIALLDEALMGDLKYPYMRHGYTCQQRYEAFKERAPHLGKGYFVTFGDNEVCNAGDLQ